jgi:hypothetical protein
LRAERIAVVQRRMNRKMNGAFRGSFTFTESITGSPA